MTEITLDLPRGLHHVLRVDAAIMDCTVEQAAIHHIRGNVEADLDLPESYTNEIKAIYEQKGDSSSDAQRVQEVATEKPAMKSIAKISGQDAQAIKAALDRGSGLSYEQGEDDSLEVFEEE